MQTEGAPKQSFFDDDDATVLFAFQKPEQKHQKDLQSPPILKETFLNKCTTMPISITKTYALHNKLIAQYKEPNDTEPELVLNIIHSRLDALKPEEGSSDYGFSISKNGTSYQFYSSDKQVVDNWLDALKKVCVLATFHDDYKAIKMIGRGSFAKVYLVESKTTGKSFAVKAFTKDAMAVSNKANAKPSMLNEIEIMRAVDHENVIKLYEVYETEKSIYLVLELIQGKSLYDYLKRSNFREEPSATRTINMVRSLLDALAYLASKGIMHRDLKPDNILLDKGEKVKIVDFGLATFVDVPAYIFKKCGTPGYIAPEVFKYDDKNPETNYSEKCDVFSVGCLFYYMLFHSPMFPGTTAADILRANRKATAEDPIYNTIKQEYEDMSSRISKDGISLLQQLIDYDQHKRISASQALNHSYFIPVPMGMQKIAGSNEFVVDALSKYSQSEIYSPATPYKVSHLPLTPQEPFSPLTPSRVDSFGGESPLLPKKDRFMNQDSLYLDLGRPEINGRTDTITSGSTNNSLLLTNRVDSSNNIGSATMPSAFANKNATRNNPKVAYRPHGQTGGNLSLRKAAILSNVQKNNSEREEEVMKNKLEGLKASRNSSEFSSPSKEYDFNGEIKRNPSYSPESQGQDQENEKPPEPDYKEKENEETTPVNVDRIISFAPIESPSKNLPPKARRFQPFAPGNLIIPKKESHNTY